MKPQRSSQGNCVLQGKVARLPNEIRNLVNTMLNAGASYSTVVRRLTELGHPGFTIFSICRWRKGGYEDWLAAQDRADLERLRAESFTEAVKEFKDPSAFTDASERLAALNTFRALQEIESRPAEELLNDPSSTFFRLARIINRQIAERTRRERLQLRKQCAETEFIEQLLADPEKLKALLLQIRARVSSPSPHGRGLNDRERDVQTAATILSV